MHDSFLACRGEYGVAESRFGRCSTMAWLEMPSTWTLRCACAPAKCGWICFSPVVERRPRSSNQLNGIEWWLYTQAALVPSVPKTPAAYVLVTPLIRAARL